MELSHFVEKLKGEKVLFSLRRHPITFVPIILLFTALFLIPIILYFLFSSIEPASIVEGSIPYVILVLLGSSYYLGIYLFFFGLFIDFYLDIWIVTNERIIDIEQHGLLSKSVSESELFRIQDITTNVTGLFPTVFHYGSVTVKTASSTTGIVFKDVRNPNAIRSELIRLGEVDRRKHYQETMDTAIPIEGLTPES